MKNKLCSVGVNTENKTTHNHSFNVSLEFVVPISENDARNWLQRLIADAAHKEFETENLK